MIEIVYGALDAEENAALSAWLGPRQKPASHWKGRYRLLADLMVIVFARFKPAAGAAPQAEVAS